MYTAQHKPALRFDYDAYIKGRLAGKYVVKYIENDIPEQTLTEPTNDNDEPVAGEIDDAIIYGKEKSTLVNESIDTGIDCLSAYPELLTSTTLIHYRAIVFNKVFLQRLPNINCRGAPPCRSSGTLNPHQLTCYKHHAPPRLSYNF